MTAPFYAAKRMRKPEEIIPFLGKGEAHYRKGYSAYELAHAWIGTDGFPGKVKAVLDAVPRFADAELVQAWFEKETDLGTRGADSQTDLLVHGRAPEGDFIIGVEGKVDEPFGDLIKKWNTGTPTRVARLEALCAVLEVDPATVSDLRYQLFHRTVAAIFEAQAFGCPDAIMLVHSFSPAKRWLDDFHRFAEALGLHGDLDGRISEPIFRGDLQLRLGWVSDEPI